MSDKERFQEILTAIRNDIEYLKSLCFVLGNDLMRIQPYKGAFEGDVTRLRQWISDVLIDKALEIDAKVKKLFSDLGYPKGIGLMQNVRIWASHIAQSEIGVIPEYNHRSLQNLEYAITKYGDEFEKEMIEIRKRMYDENWSRMKQIKFEDYVLPMNRVRYVSARDELEKVKNGIKGKKWDEIMNHIRPAIELALKEKIGLKDIHMKQFLLDAKKYNFPLPSYDTIYYYYDEGSDRLHEGKVVTPWECENALSFVSGFIDRLDLIDISQKEIEDFKKKSNSVS